MHSISQHNITHVHVSVYSGGRELEGEGDRTHIHLFHTLSVLPAYLQTPLIMTFSTPLPEHTTKQIKGHVIFKTMFTSHYMCGTSNMETNSDFDMASLSLSALSTT